MDVISFCPLRVLGFTWQPSAGTFTQTVVVKGTFRLLPEESVLAEDQEAPSEDDCAPYKPKADVVLVGHAYAPAKQPARSWMTRLVVGEIDKSIEVWCDRVIRWQDGTLLEGPRITKMPLVWERAAGGPETGNPVGMRFDAAPDRYGAIPIPNLQPPGMFVASRADTFTPIGLGPVPLEWPRTVQHGKLAPGWRDRPFPQHFNYGYFQIAPPDQQVSAIRANERIVLEKLHAEHDRLVTSLPGMTPRAVLDRATGEREEVRLAADTLWIDTDRGTCSVVWRGRIALRHAGEAGRIAVWMEGMPQVAPERSAGNIAENELTLTKTLDPFQEKRDEPVLPFTPGLSKLSESEKRELVEELSQWVGRGSGEMSGTLFAPMARAAGNALPFEGAGDDDDMVKTLPPMPKFTAMQVPFAVPSLPVAPAIEVAVKQAEKPGPLPAPPLMIGPLATAEMVETREPPEAETSIAAIGETERDALDLAKPIEPEPLPVEKYALERCAAIAASIARRKGDRARILEEEGLTAELWKELDVYWLAKIDVEMDQGVKKLLAAYDEAYVGRLEKERGPITTDEYAGLLLAAERRNGAAELKRLGLPEGVMMRIRRVWMGRSLKVGGR